MFVRNVRGEIRANRYAGDCTMAEGVKTIGSRLGVGAFPEINFRIAAPAPASLFSPLLSPSLLIREP